MKGTARGRGWPGVSVGGGAAGLVVVFVVPAVVGCGGDADGMAPPCVSTNTVNNNTGERLNVPAVGVSLYCAGRLEDLP